MRLPQPLLIAALVIAAAAGAARSEPDAPYHRVMDPYFAELDRQCPGRDLQDLTPADLELIMEGFEDRLTPPQRRDIAKAVHQGCRRTIAGLTCGNVATIRTFRRWNRLPQFTAAVCATAWRCTAPAECVQARP